MAVVFELVLNFGKDNKAAQECCQVLAAKSDHFMVGDNTIELHPPKVERTEYSRTESFFVSLVPVAVGIRVALDRGTLRISLSNEEFLELALRLYDRVRGLPNYQLAMVGWEVGPRSNLEELKADWTDEIVEGSLKGLVVSKRLLPELPASEHFKPFDNEHVWIPYEQDQPSRCFDL
jgi:hypothetical protein